MKFMVKGLVLMLLLPNVLSGAEEEKQPRKLAPARERPSLTSRYFFSDPSGGAVICSNELQVLVKPENQGSSDELAVLVEQTTQPSPKPDRHVDFDVPLVPFKDVANCLTPKSKAAALAFFDKSKSEDQAALNSAVFAMKAPVAHHRSRMGTAEEGDAAVTDNASNQAVAQFTKALVGCFDKQMQEQERIHREETQLSKKQFDKDARMSKYSFGLNVITTLWGIGTSAALAKVLNP